jgi:hypothetical protein
MAKPDKNLWTATEVGDAARKYELAVTEADRLQQAVAAARAQLASSSSDPARAVATQQLQSAEDDLAEAQDIVERARRVLACLLPHAVPANSASGPWQTSLVQYVVFGLLALIVLGSLLYGLFSDSLLASLGNSSTARGLITFLIAVVTVTIALILTLATVVSESDDRAKRFQQGKELLTVLIGVLGTIVGFYFGHSLDTSTRELMIAPVHVSSDELVSGDKVNFSTFVSGGKAPYTYDVVFSSEVLAGIAGRKSTDGLLQFETEVGAVREPLTVTFRIDVRDREGHTTQYDSELLGRKLQVKPRKSP